MTDRVYEPTPHAPVPCGRCGAILSAAGDPYDPSARPTPGALSLCLQCGALLRYGDDLLPRAVGIAEEFALLVEDEDGVIEAHRRSLRLWRRRLAGKGGLH